MQSGEGVRKEYEVMVRIRRFEETVLEEFKRGVFSGTTHTYLGQEANAVGVLSQVEPEDVVVSNHRCHGHFIAYAAFAAAPEPDPEYPGGLRALFAELMGRATGLCGGRGGSQHLHWRNFYSNGILGGTVAIATGMALAEKKRTAVAEKYTAGAEKYKAKVEKGMGAGAIVIVFLGDGALGEGIVYEAFNLASLWQAPVLYVVENNHIAQTTPTRQALAGTIAARLEAFGIPAVELDTSDVLAIQPEARRLMDAVRQQQAPRALILNTERFGPHSKGDDTRPAETIAALRSTRDPLALLAGRLDPGERAAIEARVSDEVNKAFQKALGDPFPDPELLFTRVG